MSDSGSPSLPSEVPEGSPFRAEPGSDLPESPRLGIVHLLVGTACVAVCLGMARTVADFATPASFRTESLILGGLWSIPHGAALGGLLLWASRRRRGVPFPQFPGETLLVATGILVAFYLLCQAVRASAQMTNIVEFETDWIGTLFFILTFGVEALVFLFFAIRSKQWLWRLYYLLSALPLFCSVPIVLFHWYSLGSFTQWFQLVAPVLLLVIAVRDLRRRKDYPWTHWLGIAVGVWLFLILFAWMVWQWVVPQSVG